jgi:predicted small lipoprotein YifL
MITVRIGKGQKVQSYDSRTTLSAASREIRLNRSDGPTVRRMWGRAAAGILAVCVLAGCGSSGPPSTGDIDKIAAVNSDCQNYSSLGKVGKELCDTQVANVRSVCNGDTVDRGAFINNNVGGVSQAEAELSALCPEKADQ